MNNTKEIIQELIDLLEISEKKEIKNSYKLKNFDSLNQLKLMGYLSEKHDISIKINKLAKIATIGDILNLIKKNK
jgi:acyl carrier protein|tara:strand:- start:198 stop:422 length:225 start_codon:yes stop_codon:yes gene_type:complete